MKFGETTAVVNVRSIPLDRDANATSDGEFTRVGTCGVLKFGGPLVRFTSESFGKTRYISAVTLETLERLAPSGINPVNVAL